MFCPDDTAVLFDILESDNWWDAAIPYGEKYMRKYDKSGMHHLWVPTPGEFHKLIYYTSCFDDKLHPDIVKLWEAMGIYLLSEDKGFFELPLLQKWLKEGYAFQ